MQNNKEVVSGAVDERIAFEKWAQSHGGITLTPIGDNGEANHRLFPATYFYNDTEMAWRAWANKPARAALQPAQTAPITDGLSKAIAFLDQCRKDKTATEVGALRDAHEMLEAAARALLSHPAAPAQPTPAGSEQREAVRDAVAQALTSVYVCGRVWNAWHVGTMSEDDFTPASEVDEVLDEITDAAIDALSAPAAPAQARPTDDELWDQTLRDRDHYHEMADKLAEAIAEHAGVDIGEHSNMNCPWTNALEAIAGSAQEAAREQPAKGDRNA